jgi:rod shape-determining protein MreB and related proteins
MFSKDLGIDLGTMFTRLADSTQVLLEEPTIVAIEVDDQKMVAVGREALDMYGRVPESIEVARPLKNGVIADYEITETLLSYLLQRVSGSMRIFRPRVMISVPYGVTSVERRAVYEAVLEAGSRDASLIQQPLAAALGVDLPINSPSGNCRLIRHLGTWSSPLAADARKRPSWRCMASSQQRLCVPVAWTSMMPSSIMCAGNMGW